MAENGETYNVEVKLWDEIKTQPFKTRPLKYVVCINTMG